MLKNRAFVIILVFLISLPSGTAFLRSLEEELPQEQRVRASRPALTLDARIGAFPRKFSLFFDDYFGFREQLIVLNSALKYFLFRVSAAKKVYVAKDGWLFLTGKSLDDFEGRIQLKKSELEQWHREQDRRAYFFKKKGVNYKLIIAPNKATIYPEKLDLKKGVTRLEQIIAYKRNSQDEPFIVLTDLLKDKKHDMQVYFSHGTHWTPVGFYFSFLEILSKMGVSSQHFPPVEKIKFKEDDWAPGLALMLYLTPVLNERRKVIEAPNPCAKFTKESKAKFGLRAVWEVSRSKCPGRMGKAVFLVDSFFFPHRKLIAEAFGEVLFVRRKTHLAFGFGDLKKIAALENPDFLLHQIVERVLERQFPRGSDTGATREDFEGMDVQKNLLGPGTPPEKFRARNAIISKEGAAWEVFARTEDPIIILAPVTTPKCSRKIFRVVMDRGSDKNRLEFFYKTSKVQQYHRDRSVSVATEPGRQEYFTRFVDEPFDGAIRFDPGFRKGSYRIYSIDLAYRPIDPALCGQP